MKLTSHNRAELEILKHFTPSFLQNTPIADADIKQYFDWSDRGKGRHEIEIKVSEETRTRKYTGISCLYYAKRYRDLAITSYREDWGITFMASDFQEEPKEIAEFISRAIKKPGIMVLWERDKGATDGTTR